MLKIFYICKLQNGIRIVDLVKVFIHEERWANLEVLLSLYSLKYFTLSGLYWSYHLRS